MYNGYKPMIEAITQDKNKDIIPLVTEIVISLKGVYRETYCAEPHFIKMPYWLFRLLERETWALPHNTDEIPTYLGLRVCPTLEAQTLNDIDVF